MEMDCYFNCILDIKFNEENILKILQKGKDLGFFYYNNADQLKSLTPEEAIDIVVNQDLEADEMKFLNIKMQDIWITTFFYKKSENFINISIFSDGTVWTKEGLLTQYHFYPDLVRYMMVINHFLQPFNIIKFELEKGTY